MLKKNKKVPVEKVLVLFHSFAFLHRLHKSGTNDRTRQDATRREISPWNINEEAKKKKKKKEKTRGERRLR